MTPIGEFFERASSVGISKLDDLRFHWPLGVYLDYYGGTGLPMRGRIGLGVLYVIGGVFALFHRATRPLLALHVVFSLLVPMSLHQTWLTALWYHAPDRLWYLQYASLPALAALGIGGLLLLVRRLLGPWVDVTATRQAVIWPVVLGLFLGGLNLRFFPWASERLSLFAHQTLSFTDRRVLADFQWIRDHVPAGETLLNATADWGLPLPFTGHRTVFFSGGVAVDPSTDWHGLLDSLNGLQPRASDAARDLRQRGIRYVYAASFDPALMLATGIPLGTDALTANPALIRLYESATAMVFRIRDVEDRDLGIEASDTVRFSGFYPAERNGEHAWRWTNGEGRIRVQALDLAGDNCHVRLLGSAPGGYQVRLANNELERTGLGYRIPRQALEQDVFELAIDSPTHVPAEIGDSADQRALGVMVTDVVVRCWGP